MAVHQSGRAEVELVIAVVGILACPFGVESMAHGHERTAESGRLSLTREVDHERLRLLEMAHQARVLPRHVGQHAHVALAHFARDHRGTHRGE